MIRTSWRWKGEVEAGGTAGGAGAAAGLSRCIVVSALRSHIRLFKHICQVCSTEKAGGGQQHQQHLNYCIIQRKNYQTIFQGKEEQEQGQEWPLLIWKAGRRRRRGLLGV